MTNAVYTRPMRTTRVVWPPESLGADLNIDDFVLRPRGLTTPSLISPGLILPIAAALSFSVLIAFLMFEFRHVISELGRWGYVGVFFIEMANSATIMFPTPGQAYTFALGVTLNPLMIGLIGGIGSALGELTGYAVGAKTGQRFRGGRLFAKLQKFTLRWGGLSLFVFATIPGPFEVAGLWAGTVRYPIARFFVFVAMGKILKVTAFALAGYYSMGWLFGGS
ncbi:MAG: VTT domain-containing protein [Chloroflexi bacterium]|nr:VTT domain-containing protein [Chloroflexota bacterium]